MSVMTQTAVEVLRAQPESWRAGQHFQALLRYAPSALDVEETQTYRGDSPWLLLWGPGAPDRIDAIRRHVAAGGHAIAMDLAYWHRDRKIRVSIDDAHPQRWVMRRDWPADRWLADRVTTGRVWNPNGPILVAGVGKKAKVQYGDEVDRWEADMIARGRRRWPLRKVLYRAKHFDAAIPSGVDAAPPQPIDRALVGCSLVITWHSNVAVDAIRLGVPVICHDGAAAAVCPSTFLPDDPLPLAEDLRARFLANLAWFQWCPPLEATAMWTWLQELLS